jgi:hypothetical protein
MWDRHSEARRLVGETRFKAWPTGRAMLRYLMADL